MAIRTLVQETGRVLEHPITATVIAEAVNLIDRHGLRALDSVQLATSVVARQVDSRKSVLFVASDHKLLQAAEAEGFAIWDPASDSPLPDPNSSDQIMS